jgi:hypothetical protein
MKDKTSRRGRVAASAAAGPARRGLARHHGVGALLPASIPVRLQVPETGINTLPMPLGQTADGSRDVPGGQPGDPGGWCKCSPTPGQQGPAVILGHVNHLASPEGLFYGSMK